MSLPIVTGIAAILQNVVNAYSTKQANKRQERLYREQLSYNNPASVRGRLAAAGINERIGIQGYKENVVSAPNIQATQIDLSGLAQAVEQYRAKSVSDRDNQLKDQDIYKGKIDIGELSETDEKDNPQSPYERDLNNKNLLQKGQITAQEIKNKVDKIKSNYVEKTEQNQQSLDDQRISTLEQIQKIKQYDEKAATMAAQRLDQYGIFMDDDKILQLMKIASVNLLKRKLDTVGDEMWDYLSKILFK